VHALALRLRSVFVPYYRYVMDGAVAHLTSAAAAADAQPRKKRKKRSLAGADVAFISDDAAGLRWVVRHRVQPYLSLHLQLAPATRQFSLLLMRQSWNGLQI